jgi:hypothetical protein
MNFPTQAINLKQRLLRLLVYAVAALLAGCASFAPTKHIDEVGGTTVVDYDTGEPIAGVDIYVVWRGSFDQWDRGSRRTCQETDVNAKTDAKGKFTVGSFRETASTYSWRFDTVTRAIAFYKLGYTAVSDDKKVVKMKKDDGANLRNRFVQLTKLGNLYTCDMERLCAPREIELLKEISALEKITAIPGTVSFGVGPGPKCKR